MSYCPCCGAPRSDLPKLVREEIERMGVILDERYMALLATEIPGVRYMSETEHEAIRRVCLRAITGDKR